MSIPVLVSKEGPWLRVQEGEGEIEVDVEVDVDRLQGSICTEVGPQSQMTCKVQGEQVQLGAPPQNHHCGPAIQLNNLSQHIPDLTTYTVQSIFYSHTAVSRSHSTPQPKMSSAFQTAVLDSKKLTAKPSNEELLDMYGTLRLTHAAVQMRLACKRNATAETCADDSFCSSLQDRLR